MVVPMQWQIYIREIETKQQQTARERLNSESQWGTKFTEREYKCGFEHE